MLSFSQILKITVFTFLLAISKWFKLQEPDCAHLEDLLKQINFFFFLKYLTFLEAKIF